MKQLTSPDNRTTRRILPFACATALAVAFTLPLPQPAHAGEVTPPRVPPDIEVEAGNVAFLVGHAVGTQNYVCLPSGSAFAWTLFTPEATLFNGGAKQIITHFFSPNPSPTDPNTNPRVVAAGAIRAAWQHSRDSSTVWGQVKQGDSSSDPDFVAKGAIPWLLVTVVGAQDGPTGGDALSDTTFIHRVNTSGGVAPSEGCALSTDVGRQAFVPYTADYFFYSRPDSDEDDDN